MKKLGLLLLLLPAQSWAARAVMERIAATNNTIYIDTQTTRVGIGTTTPNALLDVAGVAQFGQGATKSTFTATGALNLASGASVTATSFIGSGASLTNLGAALPADVALYSASGTFTGAQTLRSSVTASAFFGETFRATGVHSNAFQIGTSGAGMGGNNGDSSNCLNLFDYNGFNNYSACNGNQTDFYSAASVFHGGATIATTLTLGASLIVSSASFSGGNIPTGDVTFSNGSTQTLGQNTVVPIYWTSATESSQNMFNITTDSSSMKIPYTGHYNCQTTLCFNKDAGTGELKVFLEDNGTVIAWGTMTENNVNTNGNCVTAIVLGKLVTAGHKIQVFGQQSAKAGDLTVGSFNGANQSNFQCRMTP